MPEFLVVAHEAPATPEFSLADLPGAGRLDLLARCVTSALLRSHGIREDARVHLVLDDAVTITVDGGAIRHLHPDERSAAALLGRALEEREEAVGHVPVEVQSGLELRSVGLETALTEVLAGDPVVALQADGDPVTKLDSDGEPAFVLSDHRPFTDADREILAENVDARHSLGPEALHADHAIAVAHNFLDTAGYSRY